MWKEVFSSQGYQTGYKERLMQTVSTTPVVFSERWRWYNYSRRGKMFNAFYCFVFCHPGTLSTRFDATHLVITFLLPATMQAHSNLFNSAGWHRYNTRDERERERKRLPAESKISLARVDSSSLTYIFFKVCDVAITKKCWGTRLVDGGGK